MIYTVFSTMNVTKFLSFFLLTLFCVPTISNAIEDQDFKNYYDFFENKVINNNQYGYLNIKIGDKIEIENIKSTNDRMIFLGFTWLPETPTSVFFIKGNSIDFDYNILYFVNTITNKIYMEHFIFNFNGHENNCNNLLDRYKNFYAKKYNTLRSKDEREFYKTSLTDILYDLDNNMYINFTCMNNEKSFLIALIDFSLIPSIDEIPEEKIKETFKNNLRK